MFSSECGESLCCIRGARDSVFELEFVFAAPLVLDSRACVSSNMYIIKYVYIVARLPAQDTRIKKVNTGRIQR